ncbi:RNA-binding protein Raly isoform X2 [Dunckerocampus dactyliophorus]|uniref:RNA-binding protein Raly isoform X2 n=1 Tax=Dunckerocampus dactyliophorus TaxID=161453 RepID=UPI002404D643|nr:RNA-binding protein Raly isoform X2 [Dunckerocampus dactyliophorus]
MTHGAGWPLLPASLHHSMHAFTHQRSSTPPLHLLCAKVSLAEWCRMSLKVQTSNVTNKTDPKSINSRVFIGNLNTAVVSKSDVESIFSQYGCVLGCSVHKGYAFVQYANERQARGAVSGENGRVLGGQMLDINMAGEPKPSRDKTTKRAASSLCSSYDLDYEYLRDDLYDRLLAYRGQVSQDARVVPVKRPRVAPPLVHQLTTLPVKLLPRNADVVPGSKHTLLRGAQLRAIKSQLTQIKDHIEALLGRLDRFAEDTHISRTGDAHTTERQERGCGRSATARNQAPTWRTLTRRRMEAQMRRRDWTAKLTRKRKCRVTTTWVVRFRETLLLLLLLPPPQKDTGQKLM